MKACEILFPFSCFQICGEKVEIQSNYVICMCVAGSFVFRMVQSDDFLTRLGKEVES